MKNYNAAFFGLYENWFKIISQEKGQETALLLFRKVMEKGLTSAYGNNFSKGNPEDFVRLVGERDDNVGLIVKFPLITDNKIIYQFHTDPFPGLKGVVAHNELDDTYISFKVKHLLGDNWNYKNTSHIWNGDSYTEFTISR
jgi:hypothetical protein